MGGCCTKFVPDPDAQPVDLKEFKGRYWMVSTCLTMWKPENRICPCMVWIPQPPNKKGQAYHRDITEYRTGTLEHPSALKIFDGYDTNVGSPEYPAWWQWRGVGCLSLMTSDFQMIRHAPDYRWAIVAYGTTCATPAGLDVYHREPVPPQEEMDEIERIIRDTPYLREKAGDRLFRTVQCPEGTPPNAPDAGKQPTY